MSLNPVVAAVTARIVERSRASREAYLQRMDDARLDGPARVRLSCGNLAHGFIAFNIIRVFAVSQAGLRNSLNSFRPLKPLRFVL